MNSDPILVKCFGAPDSMVRGIGDERSYSYSSSGNERRRIVTIYNQKMRTWETYHMVDYLDNCPVCDRAMCVMALEGTTWLACCSQPCYWKYIMADGWKKAECPICNARIQDPIGEKQFVSREARKHIYSHSEQEFALFKLLGTSLP